MSRATKICKEIMKRLVDEGYQNEVSERWLERAIILVRGADPRTLDNWKRALEVHGFVERKRPHVFQIKLNMCPELLTNMLKGERQKKLL